MLDFDEFLELLLLLCFVIAVLGLFAMLGLGLFALLAAFA